MSDLNPLRIEDFPELTSLLSTDQIVFFTQELGRLTPYIVDLSAFSAYVVEAGKLSQLCSFVDTFEDKVRAAITDIKLNYSTLSEIDSMKARAKYFRYVINRLKQTEEFINVDLSAKASNEYLDYKFSLVEKETQKWKAKLGATNAGEEWSGGVGYKNLLAAQAKYGAYSGQ